MERQKAPSGPAVFTPEQNPYTVLGVASDAADEDIKKAYFALVRENPPERAPQRFKEIRAAYDRLKTPAQRLETDMRLWQPWQPPELPPPPEFDLRVREEDLITLLRAGSDLESPKMSKHFREVKL